MVKFNMDNVATLLSRLYYKDEDGCHYPIFKDAVPIEEVLDDEASTFFRRIYQSFDTTMRDKE